MIYELRHFDTHLLSFTAAEDSRIPDANILWTNEEKRALLPLDLEVTNAGLTKWLMHRIVPKTRANAYSLMSKCGLSLNRPMSIIRASRGLSLTDCYWITEENFSGKFVDYNLYENKLNSTLAVIALTGCGTGGGKLASCPEFTTTGMLPKCWRRDGGVIKLYKGGTVGTSDMGNEPYSEFYAAQIAKILGVDAIDYSLHKWKGVLCSVCEIFTSKGYSFVPVGRIVTTDGMSAVRAYYEAMGPEYVKALKHMLVFDAVICNVDRHFGNFGFLVDNRTNTIAAPAPLFDHGNALFNFAGKDDFQSDAALTAYAETLQPCVYDDFIGTARQALTPELHEGLRRLTTWTIKKTPRYNLTNLRLKRIQEQVRMRARAILQGYDLKESAEATREVYFDYSVDPFYSEENMLKLRKSIAQMETGGGQIHEVNLDD